MFKPLSKVLYYGKLLFFNPWQVQSETDIGFARYPALAGEKASVRFFAGPSESYADR
ncbi:MAG: hypothetical protein ACOH5I_05580 [Oligoflexus sp.]